MLKACLCEFELQKREAGRSEVEANKTDIGWGNLNRSYVLLPYQMVKDLRPGTERSDPQKVLDGDPDEFMAASLAARVGDEVDAPSSCVGHPCAKETIKKRLDKSRSEQVLALTRQECGSQGLTERISQAIQCRKRCLNFYTSQSVTSVAR